ncbi:MAG: NADPH:quinone oxidoreductase family protein [Candidatus Rokubacteria bacterium]|nr:NADPH:quinone oxidoreductase family protein [Candidatus Rokubacteria bacterium]
MKAVRFHRYGGPEVLRWEEAPDPEVRAQDVLIKVEAAGVNFSDLMRLAGQYTTKDPLPAGLGVEAAGTVVRVGEQVSGIAPGARVLCRGARGCQAEYVAVPAALVNPIPASCTFVEAAAIPVVFLTAYHMLKTLGPVRAGESVLIQAAASGVGTAAVQLARLFGARVFATASSDEKLSLVKRLGADEVINYTRQDFLAEVMARTANRGVDRILECVGGDVLTKSVKALAPGGKLFVYGRASGTLPPLSPEEFFPKNLQVIGVHIGMPPWTPEQHKAALDELLALVEAGKIRPVVDRTFRMSEVAQAHDYLAQRRTMGKVLLVP